MADDRNDPYESTARWLEEAARRRPAPAPAQPAPVAPIPGKPRREGTLFGVSRDVYMLGLLAASYLNYYFMQVLLEIETLPRLLVFYPVLQ
jgi:hypothetical protein